MTPLLLAAVFFGGGAGAVCRYGVGRFVGERYDREFPLGTFLINGTGCFALGLLSTTAATCGATLSPALLGTGFLGGYTTFSTYTLESVVLYLDGSRRLALANLMGSLAAGVLAGAAGAGVARLLWAA